MRLHRFYTEEKVDERKEISLTDPELIHQLVNVFRFQPADVSGRPGDQIIIFDGTGFEYVSEIISINKKIVVLNIKEANQGRTLITKSVSLYLSLIKKNNFELATEKCTEIGVVEIHPIISERSEKKDLNLERLNKIVKEASEQSGRVTLPQVFPITSLELAVSQVIKEGREGLVFHTEIKETERGHNRPFNRPRHQNDTPSSSDEGDSSKPTATFVGPEGGWTEKEMELFRKNNFKIMSLGQNILRAETAAILAVAKAHGTV